MKTVLPAFLEFAAGAVLVAHNSGFDVGFMKAACERHGYRWPKPSVVCTVQLARRVLSRDEAPSCRLSALADLFHTATRPTHRALADARATVEVLHALLERVGNVGVHSLEELLAYLPEVTPEQRRKRSLAAHLPSTPGVYLFRGPKEEVLYVGTASDLRRRVRQYFTASEGRRRLREMVALAVRVDAVECAHPLEAEVRELRLLRAHRPAYNRRSKNPHHAWWLTLTDEPFPRLSLVRIPRDGALGPFRTRQAAESVADALLDAVPLRSCTIKIPAANQRASPCALAELGRCQAPCAGRQTVDEYSPAVMAVRDLVVGRSADPLRTLVAQLGGAGVGRALRGGGAPPGPRRGPRPVAGPRPAPGRAGRPATARGRPAGPRGRLGVLGGALRPAGLGRCRPPRHPADAGGRRADRLGGDGRADGRAVAGRAARGGRCGAAVARPAGHPPGVRRRAVVLTRRCRGGMGAVGRAGGGRPAVDRSLELTALISTDPAPVERSRVWRIHN